MYPIDSTRFQARGTGVVAPTPVWSKADDGRISRTGAQETSESGVPLWDVEIVFKKTVWGQEKTENVSVTIPSATEPSVPEFAPLQFDQLTADFYVSKNALRHRFSAQGIATAPARRGE